MSGCCGSTKLMRRLAFVHSRTIAGPDAPCMSFSGERGSLLGAGLELSKCAVFFFFFG